MTLASAAKAGLLADDSVGSNEHLVWNPNLAFPLRCPSRPVRPLTTEGGNPQLWKRAPRWKLYLCPRERKWKDLIRICVAHPIRTALSLIFIMHIFCWQCGRTRQKEDGAKFSREGGFVSPLEERCTGFDKFIITGFQSSCFYLRAFDSGSYIARVFKYLANFFQALCAFGKSWWILEKSPRWGKRRNTPSPRSKKNQLRWEKLRFSWRHPPKSPLIRLPGRQCKRVWKWQSNNPAATCTLDCQI